MQELTEVIRRADVPADNAVGATVTLGFVDRHRRRIMLNLDDGSEALLNLAAAEHLHDGDVLQGKGFNVRVKAAEEAVLVITGKNLTRIAWHIGNRHLPAEISDKAIIIAQDHVIADMLRGLGAEVQEAVRAFSPEPGAYHSHDA